IWITLFRGFILLIAMLIILPLAFGITGIWLALPAAEAIVATVLIIFARNGVMTQGQDSRGCYYKSPLTIRLFYRTNETLINKRTPSSAGRYPCLKSMITLL